MAKKVDPQKIIETIDNNILMGTVGVAMTIVGWGEATRTPTPTYKSTYTQKRLNFSNTA